MITNTTKKHIYRKFIRNERGIIQSILILIMFLVLFAAGCGQSTSLAANQPWLSSTVAYLDTGVSTSTQTPQAGDTTLKMPIATIIQLKLTTTATVTPGRDPVLDPIKHQLLPADLLYIQQGRLMRWDHQSNQAIDVLNGEDTLASDDNSQLMQMSGLRVDDFDIDTMQQKIALTFSTGMAANGVEIFTLATYDVGSNHLSRLVERSPRILDHKISNDGKWIAYISESEKPKLVVLPASSGAKPVFTGDSAYNLEDQVSSLAWSADSRKISWTDQAGLWLYDIDRSTPEPILSNQVSFVDQSGQQIQVNVTYTDLAWSPQGRYLTARLQSVDAEVYWLALIDTRLKQFVEIPGTYHANQKSPSGQIAWLDDGRLMVAPFSGELSSAQISVYHVLPASKDYLILDQSLDLNEIRSHNDKSQMQFNDSFLIHKVQPINARFVSYVSSMAGMSAHPYLFIYDLKNHSVQQLGQAPYDVQDIIWSANAKGVVILGDHGSVIYQSRDGSQSQDLLPLLGDDPTRIIWLNRAVFSGGIQ